MELALGYQGGVGAFLTFASAYSIDLDELAKHVRENISFSYWGKPKGLMSGTRKRNSLTA